MGLHLSFKDITPERRAEMVAKSVATRKAKREAQKAKEQKSILAQRVSGDPLLPESEEDEALLRGMPVVDPNPGYLDDGVDQREERRRRLTADLPSEVAALITDEQLEAIEKKAQERAKAARLKEALRDIEALADAEAKIAQGLIPADVLRSEQEKAEMNAWGRVTVNLPPGGGSLGFRIDGRLFRHGETRRVTRAQYNSLLYMHYKAHLGEIKFSALNQEKSGNTAIDIITRNPPTFEFIPE